MAPDDSVNSGKSVDKGSPVSWGAFAVAVPVCVAREASVDADKSVDPGSRVGRLSES